MSVVNLTCQNFDEEVLNSEREVLVDFWASWCGPCKMLSPLVDEIANEYADSLKVAKVNVDEEMELAERYGVSSIPTLIVFKDGEERGRRVGAVGKQTVLDMI